MRAILAYMWPEQMLSIEMNQMVGDFGQPDFCFPDYTGKKIPEGGKVRKGTNINASG
jgi:hypothetical protein